MMSFDLGARITPRRRAFGRLITRIRDELAAAVARRAEDGFTRADLAKRLGKDKAFVTRKLNGTANMTIETLADLAWALDHDVTIAVRPREKQVRAGGNKPRTSAPYARQITTEFRHPRSSRSGIVNASVEAS